jgi:hypothetical protein
MDIHKNARLTFVRREQLAELVILQRKTLNSAAAEFKVCVRTAAKWTRRWRYSWPLPHCRQEKLRLFSNESNCGEEFGRLDAAGG